MSFRPRNIAVIAAVLALIGSVLWCNDRSRLATRNDDTATLEQTRPQQSDERDRPIVVHEDGYVGSDACRDCHEENHASWYASYHRTMTQVATPESVVGSFNNVELEYVGQKFRLQQTGDQFWMERDVQGPDGQVRSMRRRIVMTTGSHHFQAYWTVGAAGRAVDLVPATYRIDEGRWIPTHSLFLNPPEVAGTHRMTSLWNTTCNRCHATQARPRIDDHDGAIDTHVAEFGISCEACHGPGAQHVDNMQQELDELAIVHPEHLSPERSSQICGSCHASSTFTSDDEAAYWNEYGYPYRPGDELEAHRQLIHEGEDRFWSDGVVRVSGREYHGLLGSPCYDHDDPSRQMTCLSCHQMHQPEDDPRAAQEWANDQLRLEMDSNRPGLHNNVACTQCHERFTDPQELTQHTFHDVKSSGSVCYNCHMPHTTWGVMKAMRSHTITSPSIAESLPPVSRPNACNLCHLDKTLAWTGTHLHQRYGQSQPELPAEHQSLAAAVLWALKGDAGQRAVVAWNMGWNPAHQASTVDWMPPVLCALMQDRYDVIRTNAHRSLRKLDGFRDFRFDFLSTPEQRPAAVQQAMMIWYRQPNLKLPLDPHMVLLNKDGSVRSDVFDRLLSERDRRPIALAE